MPGDHAPPSAPPSAIKRQLPNILTTARVGMVLLFVLALELAPDTTAGPPRAALLLAAALFALAAATDALDGYLARRWRVISRFGRIMDPLADKLLVLTAFLYLAAPLFTVQTPEGPLHLTRVAPWMVAVILGRELLVTSLRGLLEAAGADASANWAGKAKMVLQSACVPAVLIALATLPAGRGEPAGLAIASLVWATVLATAASAWPYIASAIAHARATTRPTRDPAREPTP